MIKLKLPSGLKGGPSRTSLGPGSMTGSQTGTGQLHPPVDKDADEWAGRWVSSVFVFADALVGLS